MATPTPVLRRRVPRLTAPARLAEAIRTAVDAPTTTPLPHLARCLARSAREALVPDGEVGLHPVDRCGHPLPPVSTCVEASRLDRAQHHAWAGPCCTAMRTRQVVHVDGIRPHRGAWREFTAAAAAADVRAALALPLISPAGDLVGALALYAFAPATLDRGQLVAARRLAGPAAAALAEALGREVRTARRAGIGRAVASRKAVEPAQDRIVETSGWGPKRPSPAS